MGKLRRGDQGMMLFTVLIILFRSYHARGFLSRVPVRETRPRQRSRYEMKREVWVNVIRRITRGNAFVLHLSEYKIPALFRLFVRANSNDTVFSQIA